MKYQTTEKLMENNAAFKEIMSFIRTLLEYPLFSVNQTQITLLSVVLFFFFLLLFTLASRLVRRVMMERLLDKLKIDEGVRYNLSRVVHYIIITVGALVAFQFIGIDISSLAVIFGLLSVGIGFGLQNLTSNFVAGLMILFERPVSVGDRITVGDMIGDVMEINIRSTTLRTLSNVYVIIPNSEFVSNRVINWTYGDPRVRLELEVGVSYNSDLDTVIQALMEVARAHHKVMKKPEPEVQLLSFGDSAWNMQLRAWLPDAKLIPAVRSELNCAIVRKFREKAVEIPFPQRDLHLHSVMPVRIGKEG